MIEYVYRARLLPLNERVNVPTLPDRTPWHYTFTKDTFAAEQDSNRKIPVRLDHDRLKVVGHVEQLRTVGDWWEATLRVGSGTGCEPKIGDAVSVGLQTIGVGSGPPFLAEISFVEFGAVEGAEVLARYPAPSTRITERLA